MRGQNHLKTQNFSCY